MSSASLSNPAAVEVEAVSLGGGHQPLIIAPGTRWSLGEVVALWRYRDLLGLLALRDVRVRYKQTVLGVAWAVIQPLVTMVVLNLFFGRLMGMNKQVGTAAYPIFLYAGLLPWQFFAAAVTGSSTSLVANANILSKVYFPRLILPLSAVGAPLVDFAISFVILLGMMAWYDVSPTWALLLTPALLLTVIVAVLGVGILLAALTATYRDFRHVVPFMVQTLFFITPVIYPVTLVPQRFHWLLCLNPMCGTIGAFRAAVLGQAVDYGAWGISTGVGLVMLAAGLAYFHRVQRRLVDVV